jgi:hypothetical protein
MRRWTWVAATCGSLVVGCLFQRPGQPPDPTPPGPEQAVTAASALAPPDDPDNHSPYRPNTTPVGRKAASVDPPVSVEIGPGPAQAKFVEPPPPKPAPPDPPLTAAPAATVKDSLDVALRMLGESEQGDRETLLALIRLAACLDRNDLERLSADEVAGTLERLRQLTEQLRRRAPLTLDKVCFCKTIDGFGQYEPWPAGRAFQAGSDGQPGERIQVYVEVRNFGCAESQGRYETRLSSSLSILDEQQKVVATLTPETSIDVSQTPRQDYFLNFQLHVPANLKAGPYTLKVTVEDVTPAPGAGKSGRKAERTLDFRVCPPGGAEK